MLVINDFLLIYQGVFYNVIKVSGGYCLKWNVWFDKLLLKHVCIGSTHVCLIGDSLTQSHCCHALAARGSASGSECVNLGLAADLGLGWANSNQHLSLNGLSDSKI